MKNNKAHAFLIEAINPEESLKYAVDLIKDKTCGLNDDCEKCQSINNFMNPNIAMVNGYEEKIKIEAIESIKDFALTTSFNNDAKIIIIQGIENITVKAANSFLKFIEEPASPVLFVFTTSNSNSVLETIQTRCQIIHLNEKSKSQTDLNLNLLLKSKAFEIRWSTLSRNEIKSLLISYTQAQNTKENYKLLSKILEAINRIDSGVNINLVIAKILEEIN